MTLNSLFLTLMTNEKDDDKFIEYLESIKELANKLELPISYIEDEFVVDGELGGPC